MSGGCDRAGGRSPQESTRSSLHRRLQMPRAVADRAHLGGFEWVICGEVDVQEENASLVRTVVLEG